MCNFASMEQAMGFTQDEIYGKRLLVSVRADQTELDENIRVARVLLSCFDDMYIIINEHLLTIGHKNPEYTINGKLGDRKGIESENGIKAAFRKAKTAGLQSRCVGLRYAHVGKHTKNLRFSVLQTKRLLSS